MPIAIYRKYRPKTFAELLGQDAIVPVLQRAAASDKLAHAYLFYGSRGSGKTTAARLIAKVANCETRARDAKLRKTGEPCNTCRPCTEIDAGRGLDVVEIDAASNRGIDEMRVLKQSVNLSPTSYAYKVFIIDEAHQLTKEAFNALLKTLEEPPAHAIFILATTEYEKVPATITSRTQRFHFRRVPLPILALKLKSIIAAEKMRVTDEAIELIAASADGSFRDAESLLDQLTALGEAVTLESVERTIGKVGFARVADLAGHIIDRDIGQTLEYLHEVHSGGQNIVDLGKELIHYFRRALAIRADARMAELFAAELTKEEVRRLVKDAARINPETHIGLLRLLIRAYGEMRYSPFALIPLEVALIEHLN